MSGGKYDIFISYRRADREFVASLVRRLEALGVGVWYDADIEGGADWRETIVDALTQSDMLAIIFSEECNNSRQLKKELAVADTLGKPVVPILIENTQPRGAYLYELADRNWIQVFPEPMARIEELVEHLATLAGKSAGGLAGGRPDDALKSKIRPPPPAAAGANDDVPLEEREQKLDEAIGEMISDAVDPGRAAPTKVQEYVGRVGSGGKPLKKLQDMPPFKWIDLAVLVPGWIAIVAWQIMARAGESAATLDRGMATIALYCLLFTALYGAVVFPVRYYLRRRAAVDALLKYLGTSLMFVIAGAGVILSGMDRGYLQGEDFLSYLRAAGIAWVALTVVAFAVYGVLAGQRAIRSFRSNLRKL